MLFRSHLLINPEIVFSSEEPRSHEEGCLSLPDVYVDLQRPAVVRVRYVDQNGKALDTEMVLGHSEDDHHHGGTDTSNSDTSEASE